jgi:hypothetical protein
MKLRKNGTYYLKCVIEIDVGKPNPAQEANAFGKLYFRPGTPVRLRDYADDWVRIIITIPQSPFMSFDLQTVPSVLTAKRPGTKNS